MRRKSARSEVCLGAPIEIINVGTALTVSAAGLSTIYFLGLQYLTNNKIDLLPDSNILWKVTVVAYFSSWVLGVRFDKDNEEDAYVSAPNRGKIPAIDAALVLLVAVIFSFIAVLEEISSNADQSGNPIAELALRVFGGWAASISKLYIKYGALSFLTILNTIWFLNIFLWRYFLKRYVYDMSLRSRAIMTERHRHAGLIKLEVMDNYLSGEWQAWRFAMGAVYLVVLNVYFGFVQARGLPMAIYHHLLLCGFVLVVEAWVWFERFRVRFTLRSIESVSSRYRLTPRR